jgi:hypothetical protein
LEDLGVDGKCNIKINLEEIGWDSFNMGTRVGSSDHGNILIL